MMDVYMARLAAGVWLDLCVDTISVSGLIVIWSCVAGDSGSCEMFIEYRILSLNILLRWI